MIQLESNLLLVINQNNLDAFRYSVTISIGLNAKYCFRSIPSGQTLVKSRTVIAVGWLCTAKKEANKKEERK